MGKVVVSGSVVSVSWSAGKPPMTAGAGRREADDGGIIMVWRLQIGRGSKARGMRGEGGKRWWCLQTPAVDACTASEQSQLDDGQGRGFPTYIIIHLLSSPPPGDLLVALLGQRRWRHGGPAEPIHHHHCPTIELKEITVPLCRVPPARQSVPSSRAVGLQPKCPASTAQRVMRRVSDKLGSERDTKGSAPVLRCYCVGFSHGQSVCQPTSFARQVGMLGTCRIITHMLLVIDVYVGL